MQRRTLLTAATASLLSGITYAQNYPGKPIRLVVPFPPGGGTDLTARILQEPLSKILGQPIIIDNKVGAGGSIGMAEVAKSAPDGYTLGLATVSTHGVNPAVYKKLPYDPVNDFVAITELVKAPAVLVVNPKLPVNNLEEFIRYLKTNPGKVTYASPGNGTIGHMWAELFKSTTNTFMLHIPYRGAGPATTDLIGGQVQVMFDQLASALPHIQGGRLRALAVSWGGRLEAVPQVPTFGEKTLFANNEPSWFGLLAPAKTPSDVTKRWFDAVQTVMKDPAVRSKLMAQGLYATGSQKPDEFGTQIRKEIEKMQRIAKFAKISLD
jgi:tripartite-type tricarboxylate transporter receptor subunit TctC